MLDLQLQLKINRLIIQSNEKKNEIDFSQYRS